MRRTKKKEKKHIQTHPVLYCTSLCYLSALLGTPGKALPWLISCVHWAGICTQVFRVREFFYLAVISI